jgi:uncharacterized protein YraI
MNGIRVLTIGLFSLAVGCAAPVGKMVSVSGVGPDDFLKLRSGPGLEYRIIAGFADDTRLMLRDCVTEMGQQWCRVSTGGSQGLTGYVSADYLTGI